MPIKPSDLIENTDARDAAAVKVLTKLDAEEYAMTQELLVNLSRQLMLLPLDEFIETGEFAVAFGPLLDPTLYREGGDKLHDVLALAKAFREVKAEIRKQGTKAPQRVMKSVPKAIDLDRGPC